MGCVYVVCVVVCVSACPCCVCVGVLVCVIGVLCWVVLLRVCVRE